MKQLFFTVATIAIPGAILSWIVWLFVKGIYTVVTDWSLERELKQIREESAQRLTREPTNATESEKKVDPSVELKATPTVTFALDEPEDTHDSDDEPPNDPSQPS